MTNPEDIEKWFTLEIVEDLVVKSDDPPLLYETLYNVLRPESELEMNTFLSLLTVVVQHNRDNMSAEEVTKCDKIINAALLQMLVNAGGLIDQGREYPKGKRYLIVPLPNGFYLTTPEVLDVLTR